MNVASFGCHHSEDGLAETFTAVEHQRPDTGLVRLPMSRTLRRVTVCLTLWQVSDRHASRAGAGTAEDARVGLTEVLLPVPWERRPERRGAERRHRPEEAGREQTGHPERPRALEAAPPGGRRGHAPRVRFRGPARASRAAEEADSGGDRDAPRVDQGGRDRRVARGRRPGGSSPSSTSSGSSSTTFGRSTRATAGSSAISP